MDQRQSCGSPLTALFAELFLRPGRGLLRHDGRLRGGVHHRGHDEPGRGRLWTQGVRGFCLSSGDVNSLLLKMAIEIVDFPMKHGDFPVRYVKLPGLFRR